MGREIWTWFGAATVLVSLVPITTALARPSYDTNYDVTVTAANGFPNEDDAYGELIGTHSAGGLSDLTCSDNKFFDVDSAFIAGLGYVVAMRADFVIREPASTVSELEITVEINVAPGKSSPGTLFAFNWAAKKYEYIKAFRVKSSGDDQTLIKIEKNPGDYVNAAGDVRFVVRVRSQMHSKPEPFLMRTDLVRLNVQAS